MIRRSPVSGGAVLRLVRGVRFLQPGDLLFDILGRWLGDLFLKGDRLQVGQLDFRQDLKRHRVFEVGLAFDDALDGGLILGKLDIGLQRRAFLALLKRFLARLADSLLDHLRHYGAAVKLADMRKRHFAGPKAVQPHLVLEVFQFRLGAGLQFVGGDRHLQLTFQPV